MGVCIGEREDINELVGEALRDLLPKAQIVGHPNNKQSRRSRGSHDVALTIMHNLESCTQTR